MALTFRTGSGGKGSALTIEELDNNFRHFTGSHIVSGSLTVSGSILVSGSIIPDGAGVHSLGSADNYFKDLYISSDSLIFISGSTSSSFSIDPSGSLSGSFDGGFSGSFTGSGNITGSFDGNLTGSFSGSIDGNAIFMYNLPTSEPAESGRLWLSGSFSSSKYLMVRD